MSQPPPLVDPFGRPILYLRLSVTQICNFRCSYCQPDGPLHRNAERDELSPDEIERLVSVFARLGVKKVRLTGGEPTLRRDLTDIVARLSGIEGIEDLSLSTHGMFLAPAAAELRRAGLGRVNVSLDTLDRDRFTRIAGRDALEQVLAGLAAAREAGLTPIKLNVVPQRGVNDDEIGALLALAAELGARLRFIELMPLEMIRDFHGSRHLGGEELLKLMAAHGEWEAMERGAADGPARSYRRKQDGLKVGLIDPLNPRFCENCNRVRVTSDGDLRSCLFGHDNVPLRPLLNRPNWEEAVVTTLHEAILRKPKQHRLEEWDSGRTQSLVSLGG